MPTVSGKSEVRTYIGGIPAKMTNVLRGAARAGGKVIADEIKQRTPSEDVREAVRLKTKTGDNEIKVTIDLKPGWARSLGTWLEYGTSPHFISIEDSQRGGMGVGRVNELAKSEGSSHSLVIGGAFVGSTVFHPGARAQPAFRPALDIKEAEAIAAAQNHIISRMSRLGIAGASEGDDE